MVEWADWISESINYIDKDKNFKKAHFMLMRQTKGGNNFMKNLKLCGLFLWIEFNCPKSA